MFPTSGVTSVVPVTNLGSGTRQLLVKHLLSLSSEDRYTRFYVPTSDDAIVKYVDKMIARVSDNPDSALFAVFNRDGTAVVGLCEVAVSGTLPNMSAELALSVDSTYRRQDIGIQMLERAVLHCKMVGVDKVYMYCLARNTPMKRMARKLNMSVVTEFDESTGELVLENKNESPYRLLMMSHLQDTTALYDLSCRHAITAWMNAMLPCAMTHEEMEKTKLNIRVE